MNTDASSIPRWATASYGDVADTSPMELSALGEHLAVCSGSRGRFLALRRTAEAVHGFASARFVTTLVVASALIVVASLVI